MINTRAALRYMVLPGIIPRLRAFAKEGFGWLALMMALAYQTARLLPANHPYCNPDNIGRFGIRHVIAEAADNLIIKRENIDQILIFVALLVGFVLLALQCVLFVVSFLFKTAHANVPGPFSGMFDTANPDRDIALNMLAQVFGIEGFFCSAGGTCTESEAAIPTPFHQGLHIMFEFYSLAILLVGVLILLYHILLMVGETAQTGTPFGRRFNHVWAPLRLVVAIGLLIPINSHRDGDGPGLNSAQYIALFAARTGSGFATNTWLEFNESLTNASGLEDAALIARSHTPSTEHIMKFMLIVQACRHGYERVFTNSDTPIEVQPYFVKAGQDAQPVPTDGTTWEAGNQYFGNRDIIIRFGHLDPAAYRNETSGVKPYCGEIMIHRVDSSQIGPREVAEGYANVISYLWMSPANIAFGQRAAEIYLPLDPKNCITGNGLPPECWHLPGFSYKQERLTQTQNIFRVQVDSAYTQMVSDTDFSVPQELLERGWGGAGIWYNKIAQWNGAFISAVRNIPTPKLMPLPMEQVQSARRASVANTADDTLYLPMINGDPVAFERDEEWYLADMLNNVYNYWQLDPGTEATDTRHTGNMFESVISMIFGLDGLFTIRENHDVHPLAQLVAIGKGVVDSAVRNLTAGIGLSAIGGGVQALTSSVTAGGIFQGFGSMFLSLVTIGLAIGFILFYLLPFMPFIYFFFALGGWIKTIFEAMVGVPLWALAHLKIDGHGLPGQTAMNGYFLIFEIFIRPVLIVFGLLASLAIFTAMVRVLHEIFPLVTQNLTGFDGVEEDNVQPLLYGDLYAMAGLEFRREPVDEFFFTILYTIIVYIMATSSFKLIDEIPNSILRWMGAGVRTFSDMRDDPVGNLTQYVAYGGMNMTGQITGGLGQAAGGIGQAAGRGLGAILPGGGPGGRILGRGGGDAG